MFKMLPTARNQSSELRWIFLVAYGKKSLEEILFKMLLRKKYFREIAILNRFLDRLGPQILHEDFLQDFLRSNTKHNL